LNDDGLVVARVSRTVPPAHLPYATAIAFWEKGSRLGLLVDPDRVPTSLAGCGSQSLYHAGYDDFYPIGLNNDGRVLFRAVDLDAESQCSALFIWGGPSYALDFPQVSLPGDSLGQPCSPATASGENYPYSDNHLNDAGHISLNVRFSPSCDPSFSSYGVILGPDYATPLNSPVLLASNSGPDGAHTLNNRDQVLISSSAQVANDLMLWEGSTLVADFGGFASDGFLNDLGQVLIDAYNGYSTAMGTLIKPQLYDHGTLSDVPLPQEVQGCAYHPSVGTSWARPWALGQNGEVVVGFFANCEGYNGPDYSQYTDVAAVLVPARTLTLSPAGTGSGTLSGGGRYEAGQTASVSAVPSAGSAFAGWSGPDGAECATGTVVMNADKSCTATFTPQVVFNTPVGGNVAVSPVAGVSVTFTTVTSAGQTTASMSSTGPALPPGFQLGNPPVYYGIATTATYSGLIRVCVGYGAAQANPPALRLLHFDDSTWVNTTTSNDTSAFVICGQVTSLSPFVVAQAPPAAMPILDTFDRPDGALGGNWAGATAQFFYAITGARLDVGAGGFVYWNPTAFGSSQTASVTLSSVDPKSPSQGLLLKVQGGALTNTGAIAVVYDALAREVRVSTLRPGVAWTPYRGTSATLRSRDRLAAWVTATGEVGILRNDALLTTVTLTASDQAFFNQRGGKLGLWTLLAPNSVFDDFGGGALTR
jgi:hypothetical protein